jgi:hypothetical protein
VGLKSRINVLETLLCSLDERRSSTQEIELPAQQLADNYRKIDNIRRIL